MGFFAGLKRRKIRPPIHRPRTCAAHGRYFKPDQTRWRIASVGHRHCGHRRGAAGHCQPHGGPDRTEPSLTIILGGSGTVGVAFGLWGLNWLRRSLIVRAVGDVVLDMRTRAFRAAAEHDLSFYDQFSSGRIVSRITSDTNDFGQLVVIVTDVCRRSFQAVLSPWSSSAPNGGWRCC
jgi:hypothetical protein